MTPVKRHITSVDNVRIGFGRMVHRQHPSEPNQTACEARHPITHAGLSPTNEPVTCPKCLRAGDGRAA